MTDDKDDGPAMTRLKAAIEKRRFPTEIVQKSDLAKVIMVVEAARKLRPMLNLVADEEIELDDALQVLETHP